MPELWQPITGYEGLYEVSDHGRVKRLPGPRCLKDRYLKPGVNKSGHLNVALCKDSSPKSFLVHRLVGYAFLQGDHSLVINHIDGNPANNTASNLEFVTQQQNVEHGYKIGLNPYKVPPKEWSQVRERYAAGVSQTALAKEYGCVKGTIWNIIHR